MRLPCIEQWCSFFREQFVDNVTVFDAHWDNPIKINQIYDSILNTLEPEQQALFTEGLNRFKEKQKYIRQEACRVLASILEDCIKKAAVTISKRDYADKRKLEDAKEQVVREINGSFAKFVYHVSELYKIAAEHPTCSRDELLFKTQKRLNYLGRATIGGGFAGIVGGTSGLLFGVLGGVITGLMTGGIGILPAAMFWAQIGVLTGGAAGGLFVFRDSDDNMTIEINEDQINALSVTGISIIWGLSSNGYGREKELSSDECKKLTERIERLQASHLDDDHKMYTTQYYERILTLLEKDSI
jgi:Domain of unknown function (DUF3482)